MVDVALMARLMAAINVASPGIGEYCMIRSMSRSNASSVSDRSLVRWKTSGEGSPPASEMISGSVMYWMVLPIR